MTIKEEIAKWLPTGDHKLAHDKVISQMRKNCFSEFSDKEKDELYKELFADEVKHIMKMKKRAGRI